VYAAGYQAKTIEDVPGNPTLAVTADFNYVLRFYKGSGRVWVKDVQGNDVTIKSRPIQFGQISVIPIDTVLMSGGYFFTGLVRRLDFLECVLSRRWASTCTCSPDAL
jgi:hypothetical protein